MHERDQLLAPEVKVQRIDRERFFETTRELLPGALRPAKPAQQRMALDPVGRTLEDPGEAGDRRLRLALGHEGGGQSGDDLMIGGRKLESAAEGFDARQARL